MQYELACRKKDTPLFLSTMISIALIITKIYIVMIDDCSK